MACLICSDTVWGIFDIHVVQGVNYSVGTVYKTLTTLSQLVISKVWRQTPSLEDSLKLKRSGSFSWGVWGGVETGMFKQRGKSSCLLASLTEQSWPLASAEFRLRIKPS